MEPRASVILTSLQSAAVLAPDAQDLEHELLCHMQPLTRVKRGPLTKHMV